MRQKPPPFFMGQLHIIHIQSVCFTSRGGGGYRLVQPRALSRKKRDHGGGPGDGLSGHATLEELEGEEMAWSWRASPPPLVPAPAPFQKRPKAAKSGHPAKIRTHRARIYSA